jgi:hypothetical protein
VIVTVFGANVALIVTSPASEGIVHGLSVGAQSTGWPVHEAKWNAPELFGVAVTTTVSPVLAVAHGLAQGTPLSVIETVPLLSPVAVTVAGAALAGVPPNATAATTASAARTWTALLKAAKRTCNGTLSRPVRGSARRRSYSGAPSGGAGRFWAASPPQVVLPVCARETALPPGRGVSARSRLRATPRERQRAVADFRQTWRNAAELS